MPRIPATPSPSPAPSIPLATPPLVSHHSPSATPSSAGKQSIKRKPSSAHHATPSSASDSGSPELKPDISADEEGEEFDRLSKRGKAGRGSPKRSKAGAGAGAGAKAKVKREPKRSQPSGGGGSGASGAPYTPEEDWALFGVARPKPATTNWAVASQVVGRDAKSCQNRWALLNKKLEGAVKGIGGA